MLHRSRRTRRSKWVIDILERRDLMTVFAVNTTLDLPDTTPLGDEVVDVDPIAAGNQVSLRGALEEANAHIGDDSIILPSGDYVLAPTPSSSDFGDGLTISDPQGLTIITGNGPTRTRILMNSSSLASSRIFNVIPQARLQLSDVALSGGSTADESGAGGAILNRGFLTLSNVDLSNNQALNSGGGIANLQGTVIANQIMVRNNQAPVGGAIANLSGNVSLTDSTVDGNAGDVSGGIDNGGEFTVLRSTISHNHATAPTSPSGPSEQAVGGINNHGVLTLATSTLSDNQSTRGIGGLFNQSDANATLTNSTVTSNLSIDPANDRAGGIVNADGGRLDLFYTLVAENRVTIQSSEARNDVQGEVSDISSFNLIGTAVSMTGIVTGVHGNQIGTELTPIDPLLGPLQNNGGATWTRALVRGSPAIDAGEEFDSTGFDQRGVVRPQDGDADGRSQTDVGAFEFESIQSVIRGIVFDDRLGDGEWDATADQRLRDIEVRAIGDADGDGTVETLTALTNDDGIYEFVNLLPGTYTIDVSLGARTPTTSLPLVVDVGVRQQIVAFPALSTDDGGEMVVDGRLNLGTALPATVLGTVWLDQTGDGVTTDDRGFPAISVDLRRDNGDGQLNDQDNLIDETTTTTGGEYTFDVLRPGAYWLEISPPVDTRPVPIAGISTYRLIQVTSGETIAAQDFALVHLYEISGRVSESKSGVPQSDWTLELYDAHGNLVTTTRSDVDGRYSFRVASGEYTVKQRLSSAWEPLAPGGRFASRLAISSGAITQSVLTADVDEDSDVDVVVVDDTSDTVNQTSSFVVYLNNGQGAFSAQAATPLPTGVRPRDSKMADLNGDGHVDLILASYRRIGNAQPTSGVFILNGDGRGSFTQRRMIATTADVGTVDVADFDGDGQLDLIAAHPSDHYVSVWLNRADSFVPQSTIPLGVSGSSVVAADFNQDNHQDLIVLSYQHDQVQLWQGAGNGRFTWAQTLMGNAGAAHAALWDWDDDGRVDLAIADRMSDAVRIYRNLGSHMQLTSVLNGARGPQSLVTGDFNQDGLMDLAVTNAGADSLSVFYQTSGFAFSDKIDVPTSVTTASPQTLAIGDVDGNGLTDLVVGNYVLGGEVLLNQLPQWSVHVTDQAVSGLDFINQRLQPANPRASLSTVTQATSLDVNQDGFVTPLDALLIINWLGDSNRPSSLGLTDELFDVSADGVISPLDALLVINHLNASTTAEAESPRDDVEDGVSTDFANTDETNFTPTFADIAAAQLRSRSKKTVN